MSYVLITLTRGITDRMTFYDDPYTAMVNLSEYVKSMNPDENDAVVYGPDGLITNAKIFPDKNDPPIQNPNTDPPENKDEPIYIIANPCHILGFLVIGKHGPVGFTDPGLAISILEQLRKDIEYSLVGEYLK